MPESVDDILRELGGISFAEGDDPPEAEPAYHTPSVTETLRLVREMLGEGPEPQPEPPEPVWEEPLSGYAEPEGTPPEFEEPAEDGPEETAGALQTDSAGPAESPETVDEAPEEAAGPLLPPEEEPPVAEETVPFAPQVSGGRRFTPVVRMGERLPGAKGRSRRETAARAGETRKFSPDPALQRGKLAGGAGLKKVTRAASDGEPGQPGTIRLDTPGARPKPSPEAPAEGREEELQSVLDQVEALEKEPTPDLDKAELRKLRRAQRAAGEARSRRKRAEEAQKEEKNLYTIKEKPSSETKEGFAPCFRKMKALNSSARVSEWKRALRDMAGSSMGIAFLEFFFAAAILVLESLPGLVAETAGRAALLWTSALLGAAAGVAGGGVLASGAKTFFLLRENRDNLPFMVYCVTMAQTVLLALNPEAAGLPQVHAFLPVGILSLSAAYLARWTAASAATRNLRFLNSGGAKYYLHVVRDGRLAAEMTRGIVEGPAFVAVNRRTEAVSDFMRMSFAKDDSDRMGRNLASAGLAAALLSLGFGTLFTGNVYTGMTIMAAVACLCAPILTPFLFVYPSRRAAKFMERAGGVVIGEKAMNRYSLLNGSLIDAARLFPPGFTTLSGIKTYGSARLDDVIIDAASIVLGSGSVLESIFEGVVGKDGKLLRPVEGRVYEDGRGLTGFVGGEQVLFGNRALLESRGIPFPVDEHRAWTAGKGCAVVYLAAAGELAGAFLIRLQPAASEEAVQVFADNGVTMTVRTADGFMTPRLLGRLFRVNPDRIKILPQRLSVYADRLQGEVRIKQAVAVNDGAPMGFAGCAACAKRLVLMEGLNRALVILAVLLGLAMFLMLTVLGSLSSVTAAVMAGYAVFWPALGWVLQKLVRI